MPVHMGFYNDLPLLNSTLIKQGKPLISKRLSLFYKTWISYFIVRVVGVLFKTI